MVSHQCYESWCASSALQFAGQGVLIFLSERQGELPARTGAMIFVYHHLFSLCLTFWQAAEVSSSRGMDRSPPHGYPIPSVDNKIACRNVHRLNAFIQKDMTSLMHEIPLLTCIKWIAWIFVEQLLSESHWHLVSDLESTNSMISLMIHMLSTREW